MDHELDNDIFFIDTSPDAAAIPVPSSPQQKELTYSEPPSSTLLLPSHVSVFGSAPVQILPSPSPPPEGEENYIEFLDYGGNSNVRYSFKPLRYVFKSSYAGERPSSLLSTTRRGDTRRSDRNHLQAV